MLTETERVLELRPDLGSLVEDARELRERVAATSGPAGAWAMSLTGAELRLLPYLATHLTFPEIATRLFISRNTVKTEAVSIYRKLGASSRSEAIERAVEVGLLESFVPPRADFIPDDSSAGLERLDVAGDPGLVEPGLERAVEPQDGEPLLAGDGLDPVAGVRRRARSVRR